jgi:GTP cyclohydrolase I
MLVCDKTKEDLPDVQESTKPNYRLEIDHVGVSDVNLMFSLYTKFGKQVNLLANVTMTSDLDKDTRGISMSRFLRTIEPFLEKPLKNHLIREILQEFQTKVNPSARKFSLTFRFHLPYYKSSPVSGHVFPEFYPCWFTGVLEGGDQFDFYEGVTVQYASYCPCSAELCEMGEKGFPHAQRSFATVWAHINLPNIVWLEDLVQAVEQSVVTTTYPIVTRIDEYMISKIAKQNCQFVEDSVRSISNTLKSDSRIKDWVVVCRHEESIHKSTAVASIASSPKVRNEFLLNMLL